MGTIDVWLHKRISKKLSVVVLAILVSLAGKMNPELAGILMAYIFGQSYIDKNK